LNPQPSTLNPQPSTLNPQPSTLSRPGSRCTCRASRAPRTTACRASVPPNPPHEPENPCRASVPPQPMNPTKCFSDPNPCTLPYTRNPKL
ncbi:hypothetical protein T484DRAFT_1650418, partial [Baffinella frigidus]